MEFRISDILDAVDASDITIEPRKVTSNSRIEELVFKKIPLHKNQKFSSRKTARTGLLVAALIVVLSFSIMAAASDMRVADIFGNFFGFPSQGQKDTIDEISMIHSEEIPISASANGTTVTLQTAIGVDHNCYLKLQ